MTSEQVGQVHADDTTVTVSDATAAIAPVGAVVGASAHETTTADSFVSTVNGSTTEIPKDPSDGLTMTTPTGAEISVDLPFADTANDGAKTKTGAVVYADAAPDVAVAAQPTADGGMRALVVIDGPQAPTEYRYPMTLPADASLLPTADGGAAAIGTDGQLITYIAPPWALDANKQPVPTQYRIEGTTLVQVIDHQGATYPSPQTPAGGVGRVSRRSSPALHTGLPAERLPVASQAPYLLHGAEASAVFLAPLAAQ
ncbi:MAG: hypothetical protein WCP59_14770 [Actinomycetota bacterium]